MTPPPAGRTVRDADPNGSGKITRDVVLAAALEIIDRDGADGLSMRRLARAGKSRLAAHPDEGPEPPRVLRNVLR